MPDPSPIRRAVQLAVEGRDAEVFFDALLRHLGLEAATQLQNYGGIDELPIFMRALASAVGFPQVASLGIVRDAETDPRGAFQSTCSALRNAGLPAPRRPGSSTATNPRVSVLILPDGSNPGMLEDLCLQAVAGDPAMECVDAYLTCLVGRLGSVPANVPKARAHTFLASRPKPDLQLGEAAHAGYWPLDSPAFHHVKQFLQAL